MSDDTADLDSLRARLAEESYQRDPDGHPTAETLAAYQADKLSSEENDAIQEHVASCSLCAERLLDLQRFLDFAPEERSRGDVVDLETAAEWRQLYARTTEVLVAEPSRSRLLRRLRAFQALAAVLGALLVGVSLYVVRLHWRPQSFRPMPEQTIDFTQTRSGGQLKEIEVRLPVALKFLVEAGYPRYKVEIRANDQSLLYSYDRFQKTDLDRLTLPLPDGSLAPGSYIVHLFGLREGQFDSIASPVKLIVHP